MVSDRLIGVSAIVAAGLGRLLLVPGSAALASPIPGNFQVQRFQAVGREQAGYGDSQASHMPGRTTWEP